MGSGVRLRARKHWHPHNAHPKTVSFNLVLSFYDDSGLLFYFHTTGNGYKILVLTNTAKLPQILLGWFKAIIWTYSRKIFILFLKIDIDYFGKIIGDLSWGSRWKRSRILPGIFKDLSLKFSWNVTANTKSFIVGVLTYLKKWFYLIYSKRKIVDFIEVQAQNSYFRKK